jgi:hypothetical protein
MSIKKDKSAKKEFEILSKLKVVNMSLNVILLMIKVTTNVI